MKLKEAIVHCDEIIKKMDNCDCRKEHEELKEFLEELQKYRDTGLTPEQIRELKERDTAKAPEPAPLGMDGMVCPSCGKKALPWDRFCGECGQAIDTENLEGMEDE